MKKILTLICTLLCANVLLAQTTFWIDSLQYKVTSTSPAEVEVYDAYSSITTANIPSTVTYQETTYSVTSIRGNQYSSAFWDCSSLTSVTIPNSVTYIEEWAFKNCSSLTSITIPNSVTYIGGAAFYGCSSLTSVTLSNNITELPCDYINSFSYGLFEGCSSLTSVTIPNSVTSIGRNAFRNCSSLTSVTIPNSVTSIGDWAFSSCKRLTSITIPNSVTSIEDYAFDGCIGLTSVILPGNATISNNAFRNVGTGIVIDSVTYSILSESLVVGSNEFDVGFTTFYLGDNVYRNPVVNARVGGCDTNKIEVVILSSIEINDMEYPVTSIGNYAFKDCSSLTSITIPNSVTSIEYKAFSGCSSLTSITIPNSVNYIHDYAFIDCSSLTSVTIPNSVTSIGDYAFRNCSSLTSITIPNSVTSIGDSAFASCSSLTSMIVEYTNIPNLSNIGLNSTLRNLTLGENVTSIASGAFNNYSFLQNVTCLATTPPTIADNTVFPYPNIATLTVPCGTLEAYSAPTSFWNMFFAGRISEDCGGESGLEDLNAVEISFFPNPTNSKVTFNQAIERIELMDLAGKTLRTYENESEINIEQLPAGVYYLRLTNNEKQTLRKLIKE